MKIIVHYPKNKQNMIALRKKAASVHADAVLRYLQKQTCPKAQKLQLYNEIKKAYADRL